MLVISRRLDESLLIGDDVVVTILGIKGNQIRIGVQAPDEIAVYREELYLRLTENEDSADRLSK